MQMRHLYIYIYIRGQHIDHSIFLLWLYNGCNPCTDTFPYDEHKFVIISLYVIKLNIVCIDLSCQFRWINIVLVKNVEVHI